MNVLFLHTPKFNNYCKPIGHYSFVLFPPIGLLGLADFLVKNKHTAKIIHLGVEQHQHGPLDFDRIISEKQPLIVGLDLHWHFQSYDVIEVARKIKQARPEVRILLGGFTASLFAEEILRDHPFVDFVIRGDAEIPLLQLARHFESDKNYSEVPNLAYRHESDVLLNPITYAADSAMLDSICFTDFTLMKDYPCLRKFFFPLHAHAGTLGTLSAAAIWLAQDLSGLYRPRLRSRMQLLRGLSRGPYPDRRSHMRGSPFGGFHCLLHPGLGAFRIRFRLPRPGLLPAHSGRRLLHRHL